MEEKHPGIDLKSIKEEIGVSKTKIQKQLGQVPRERMKGIDAETMALQNKDAPST